MTIQDRRALRAAAEERLANTPNEKRLVLLWASLAAIASLLSGLISYLLDTGIAGTGGLSGMQLRSILTTAQEFFSTAITIALPFWALGYQRSMLQIARKRPVTDGTLLEGFRRFGPGLRLMLVQSFLYTAVFLLIAYVTMLLLAMTPLADPVYAVLDPVAEALLADDPMASLDEAMLAPVTEAMTPLMVCAAIAGALVVIPMAYRRRFAQLCIVDDYPCGAMMAMGISKQLTRRNCLSLLKLDLQFWWFWLLEGVIVAVTYGDSILPVLGITLPISADVAFWAFYVAALVLQVAVYTAFHNRVSVTYALAYDSLLPKPQRPVPEDATEESTEEPTE